MRVLCTNGVKAVTAELFAVAERALGLAIDADYGSTQLLMEAIGRGSTGDLAILSAEAIEELIGRSVLQQGSRTDLARSCIGVAVRRGTPSPDIGSVDALIATLRRAKSVLYSKSGISGAYVPQLMERLGIADAIMSKAVHPSHGTVGEALARGEAEMALQQISELMGPGIKVVGPLPDPAQLVTVFSAGIFCDASEPRAARMLLERLTANAARPLYAAKGLEPAF
ncbi:MAG: substrate-binding domain-containing protein [Hyphomicrobiales bacterium]|nr:substrate-binding domain-containing protein [Hyphomicrobiales bacterium]